MPKMKRKKDLAIKGIEEEQKTKKGFSGEDDLGILKFPLCREPWESYYILRRGILPCCHGNPIIAPITDWASAWNSPQIQEIRSFLSQGKLSPYCLESHGCPIVQKYLSKKKEKIDKMSSKSLHLAIFAPQKSFVLRLLNRLFFRIPGKMYRILLSKKTKRTI